MSLPWIKVHGDLMDHPRALDLADDLDCPMAWAHLVAMWAWCAQYARDGRIVARNPERTAERAARWDGEPGAFVEAAIANGWLARDGDALEVCGWDKHQRAHLEKAERDRRRIQERRAERRRETVAHPTPDLHATAAGVSRDSSATVARQSANGRAGVAGEKEKEKEIKDPPPYPPLPCDDSSQVRASSSEESEPVSVGTHEGGLATVPGGRLSRGRTRRTWSGPPTGEVADVWHAWRDWCEPNAVWSDARGELIAGWLAQGIPAEKLKRAIEGYAGDPYWRGEGRRYRTLERVLDAPASLERGWAMRDERGWRDPRRRREPVPRSTPIPPPVNGTPKPIEELGGVPEFLRAERVQA